MHKLLAQLIYVCVRLLCATWKIRHLNPELREQTVAESGNYIFAIWHRDLAASILSFRKVRHVTMASPSKDGDLIAHTLAQLGFEVARASSDRNPKKGLIEMIRKVRGGLPGALTVDGPKGPAHVAKPGVFSLAKACQCPILPLVAYPEDAWIFEKSWDRFRLPKPFSRITLKIGEPIVVNSDNFDQLSRLLEERLLALEAELSGKKREVSNI